MVDEVDGGYEGRLGAVPVARRGFVKGVLIAGALGAPVVQSVGLGASRAFAESPNISGASTTKDEDSDSEETTTAEEPTTTVPVTETTAMA